MRARLLLPTLWLLSLLLPAPARAQGRPLGPWRLTYEMEQRWVHGSDTIAKELVQKWVPNWSYHPIHWDIEPDSIRLFLNCENLLIAPALPRSGQLPFRFTATGATVRVDAKSHRLLVAPSAAVVTLYAHKGQALVFKHVFTAIPPPLPQIECYLRDEEKAFYCFGQKPVLTKLNERYSISARVTPNMNFAMTMPEDARYRAKYSRATLLRNGIALEPAKPFVRELNLSVFQTPILPGDQIRIDIQSVQRMNFRGHVESIALEAHRLIPVSRPSTTAEASDW